MRVAAGLARWKKKRGDKLPPLDLLGTEGGSPFGPVGRFFYAGAEFKF